MPMTEGAGPRQLAVINSRSSGKLGQVGLSANFAGPWYSAGACSSDCRRPGSAIVCWLAPYPGGIWLPVSQSGPSQRGRPGGGIDSANRARRGAVGEQRRSWRWWWSVEQWMPSWAKPSVPVQPFHVDRPASGIVRVCQHVVIDAMRACRPIGGWVAKMRTPAPQDHCFFHSIPLVNLSST